MNDTSWIEHCYEALGVPADLPDDERRRLAERVLLETTDQPVDILGLGAAEAALDLVVRYGAAGELDEILHRWEQAENLGPELARLGDEGTRRATLCAKKLVYDVVWYTESRPSKEGDDNGVPLVPVTGDASPGAADRRRPETA